MCSSKENKAKESLDGNSAGLIQIILAYRVKQNKIRDEERKGRKI